MNLKYAQIPPKGGFDIFTDRDQRSIFGGFELRKSVFFWVLIIVAVFVGCQTNAVFLSVLICFAQCFFLIQFYSPDTSVSTGHHYHLTLNIC